MKERMMRRARQELPHGETMELLVRATSGVLAVLGDGGYPYAVPLSFAFVDGGARGQGEALRGNGSDAPARAGTFYFHCATAGHKLDAIAHCDRASFAVIADDEVLPEQFTTRYRSVIAFGRVRLVVDDTERMDGLRLLAAKYSPGLDTEFRREVEGSYARTCVLAMDVERLTGKEAIEFTRMRS